MRLSLALLALLAASLPLRAAEVRVEAVERPAVMPAFGAAASSLQPLSPAPLSLVSLPPAPPGLGPDAAGPSAPRASVAGPGASSAQAVGALPVSAAGAAAAPRGAEQAGRTAETAGTPGTGGAPGIASPTLSRTKTSPGRGFGDAEPVAARSLAFAHRIAAALGAGAAPQDLPVEAAGKGGAPRLGRPSPRPSPPARPGVKRLFGPSLALGLMALPSLAHANPFAPLAAGIHLTVSLPLALLAAAIALARLPVTNLLVKTNPHSLGEGDGGSDKLARLPLLLMPPVVFFFAACEEVTFRGLVFGGGIVLLIGMFPAAALHPAPLYAGMALLSSLGFAYMHRYSEMWPRFIGGLVYCAALAMTGSLLFPSLIHAFYNLTLLVGRKRELAREEGKR